MKALVETSIPPTFRFLSLMFSPHFSNISRKKEFLYLNKRSHPSAIQAFLQEETHFNILKTKQLRSIEKNHHQWLITDILQLHCFQYQFESTVSLFDNVLDVNTNLFGILNSKTLVLTFYHNSLKMIFYLFSLPLTIVTLILMTSLIVLLPISHSSPSIIIVLIRVFNFLFP